MSFVMPHMRSREIRMQFMTVQEEIADISLVFELILFLGERCLDGVNVSDFPATLLFDHAISES